FEAGCGTDLSRADGSLHERAQLWQVAVAMVSEHPLVGIGKGNYLLTYPQYAAQVAPDLVSRPLKAHMMPLQIAAETGLVGLGAVLAIVVATALGAREARR